MATPDSLRQVGLDVKFSDKVELKLVGFENDGTVFLVSFWTKSVLLLTCKILKSTTCDGLKTVAAKV